MIGIDPITIEFDPTLPYSERTGLLAGCPPGYFVQFVEKNMAGPDTILLPPIPGMTQQANYVHCRLIPDSILDPSPPETVVWTDPMSGMTVTVADQKAMDMAAIQAESGTSWTTTAQNFEQAVKDTVPQAKWNIGLMLAIAAGIYLAPSILSGLLSGRR